ncbi:phosphatase PAP2 family protein [Aquimarina brevivitae]|uniref:Undecaprenyl-diphosphatase n=1 Tax=Aquimarina brevivitae TaxID=323412 RepID=A0A4Q7PI59_9FLAO|nr:phosphatase PAP2 family protein [Aquimarina brevivitae]RZT00257.1 undecaprenyl-diphosphatase [Aquimarina brevivitae]
MIETLHELDQELFLFLNGLGTSSWDGFWLFMTEKFYQIPLYLVLLLLFYKYYGKKGTLITLLTVALLITASDQLANLFKYVLVQRPRPCQPHAIGDLTRLVAEHCGRYGFFSGHSTSSMALAVFTGLTLRKYLKYIFPFMICWSIIVSYSRIYLGVHYPGDVLVGWTAGTLLGLLAYNVFNWGIKKYAPNALETVT